MNNEEYEKLRNTVNDQGIPFEHQYLKRTVEPSVVNGQVSIPRQNELREKYGEDFTKEYMEIVKNGSNHKGSLNNRSRLVNISADIRRKQANKAQEIEKKNNVEQAEGGHEESKSADDNADGGHENSKTEIDDKKKYYLEKLRRRIDLVQKKYGIEFDRDLIEFFESDEYFLDGKIPDLDNYEALAKIDKAWNTAQVMNNNAEEINKIAEENAKAIETMKKNALLFGDKSLYDSVVEDCNELEQFIDKSKEVAIQDEKYYNDQKIKEKVEVAILCIVSQKAENPKLSQFIDVLKNAINKRTEYMTEEIKLKSYARDLETKEINAKEIEEIADIKTKHDRVVDLLDDRRGERGQVDFATNPEKVRKEEYVEETTKEPLKEDNNKLDDIDVNKDTIVEIEDKIVEPGKTDLGDDRLEDPIANFDDGKIVEPGVYEIDNKLEDPVDVEIDNKIVEPNGIDLGSNRTEDNERVKENNGKQLVLTRKFYDEDDRVA